MFDRNAVVNALYDLLDEGSLTWYTPNVVRNDMVRTFLDVTDTELTDDQIDEAALAVALAELTLSY